MNSDIPAGNECMNEVRWGLPGQQASSDLMKKVTIYLTESKKANRAINRTEQAEALYLCNLLLIDSRNPRRFILIVKI